MLNLMSSMLYCCYDADTDVERATACELHLHTNHGYGNRGSLLFHLKGGLLSPIVSRPSFPLLLFEPNVAMAMFPSLPDPIP